MGIFFFKLGIIKKNLVLELHRWLSRSSLETNMLKKNHALSTAVVQEQSPSKTLTDGLKDIYGCPFRREGEC